MNEVTPKPTNSITDNPDVQRRMAELGQRYLERTAGELLQLQSYIEQLAQGDGEAVKNIEVLAHRIRGSGAMFGFELMSDVAGEIELLAAMLRVLTFVLGAARR
jgi:HPt (histidine-containing phosphotransfer) domain-containing protein